jgi:predicted DNA binding CopG/RHH family protein
MKPKKRLPKFKSEVAERRFWATHDSTEYLDWSKARRVLFPNLKPSVKTISIRLPESLLDALKTLANERDVPYQSLVKMILAEQVEEALHHSKT